MHKNVLNICMFDNDKISHIIVQNGIAGVVVDVCRTLYINGIDYVHVGALMRLLGIHPDDASAHDETYFHLDEEFVQQLEEMENIEDSDFDINLAENTDTPPTIH